MNIEAEINKELIKVLKEKILLLEEQKTNSQEIINIQKEQLILSDVSQQRELLLAYTDYLVGLDIFGDDNELVDGFIKANNCG